GGALRQEHARDRPRAGDERYGVRALRGAVLRALPVGRRRHGPHRRAQRRDVGRGGRILLRRAPTARWPGHAAQGALDGGPAPALRQHGDRAGGARALPAPARARTALLEVPLRARDQHRITRPPRRARTPAPVGAERDEAAAHPRLPARRARVPGPVGYPGAAPPSPRAPLRLPGGRRGLPRGLRARRVHHRAVRWELELARAHLDADERADPPGAAPALLLLR